MNLIRLFFCTNTGRRTALALLSLCAMPHAAVGQGDAIKISPIGRALFDAAAYAGNDNEDFEAGVVIPEIRLGVKGSYQNFNTKIELGYAYSKLTLKDVYLQAKLADGLSVYVGNMIIPYGLQSAYSASMKTTMEAPSCNSAFDIGRAIGVDGVYYNSAAYASLALTAESKASVLRSNEMGKTSWGGATRLVWAPINRDGRLLSFGWSGALSGAQYDEDERLNHRSFTISANYPTQVSRIKAVSALVDDASLMFRCTPELTAAYGRVALESQYYYNLVSRKDGAPDYTAYGAYATLRCILRGGGYSYLASSARLDTPAPKSLELAGSYSYTCLDDSGARIRGGRISDVSMTLNWYVNRYIIWRVCCSYSHCWGRPEVRSVDLGTFQTRLQIIF